MAAAPCLREGILRGGLTPELAREAAETLQGLRRKALVTEQYFSIAPPGVKATAFPKWNIFWQELGCHWTNPVA